MARVLDSTTLQFEIERAYTKKQIDSKIKMIEKSDEATKEQRDQAIAQLKMQVDQVEVKLEGHVQFREFVRNEYGF